MSSATLSEQEVLALMEAIQEGTIPPGEDGLEQEGVPYDLTSQDRVIRGQMPTLDSVNDRIASLFAAGLAGRTRLAIRVTTKPATLMKFAEFSSLLAPPATIGLLSLGEGRGSAAMVLEPGLAEMLLAAAMGDRNTRLKANERSGARELTGVDRLVLRRLLSRFTEAMRVAWQDLITFDPELRSFESDPRLAVIAAPNDVTILCTFEIEGAMNGLLQLGIPYAAVESAKKLLQSPTALTSGGDRGFIEALAEQLLEVDVDLQARLGRVQMTLSDFLAVEVGDVLVLDQDEDDALPVFVQERPKLKGHPHTSGGNLALVLDRGLAPPFGTRI